MPSIGSNQFTGLIGEMYDFFPVRVIQVKNCCTHKITCLSIVACNFHSKVRRVAIVIDSFLAKQMRINVIVERLYIAALSSASILFFDRFKLVCVKAIADKSWFKLVYLHILTIVQTQ